MNSFNPSKYSYSTESDNNSVDVSDEVVEKGHKNILKVDIEKFEELCKKFSESKDMKIKKLSGKDKEDFDLVVSYVHLLYGTEYYGKLFEKVKKHFKSVKNVKPGTVGNYFAGCMVSKGNGCSLACAGSMPLPKDEEGWSSCDKAVIMAEKTGERYNFSFIKPAISEEDLNPAYVFVESDFEGFDEYEKENLKAMGCKKVKLIGYSSDMNYSEMETSDVKNIRHRRKKSINKKENNYWWLLVLFIILLIVFLVLLYRYSQTRYSQVSY